MVKDASAFFILRFIPVGFLVDANDNKYIISSPLFQILRENTINMGEEDPLPLFISKKCIHLNTWVFDKHLGNREDIGVVFSYISNTDIHHCILWCEYREDLLFCKIDDDVLGNTSAVTYFKTHFPKQ